MVALAILVVLVLTLAPARGDDAACLANDAAAQTAAQTAGIPTAEPVATRFLVALNAERAKYSLQPVIGSLRLEQVAAENNRLQAIKGGGHHFLGGFGQCAGFGYPTMGAVIQGWLGSPSHRALILAPDLSMVGYHQLGSIHTVSTWQGGVQDSETIGSKPAAHSTCIPSASVERGAVTESAAACPSVPGVVHGCGAPGRRGFHPFQRLLGRLRVNVSFGVSVHF
jgi:hypothetical protein